MAESPTLSLDIAQSRRTRGERAPHVSSKRQQVLDVAAECFLTHGYEGASINAMSRGSGISKESIYRYFSSKKELFEAVIDRELTEYQRRLDRLDTILDTMELREALVVVAETGLSVLASDRTLALRRLVFEEAMRSPELGHHYYRIGPERAYATLRKLFTDHVDQSEFDADTLGTYFIAMSSFSMMVERQCRVSEEPSREEVSRLAHSIVDDFLAAFLRDRG